MKSRALEEEERSLSAAWERFQLSGALQRWRRPGLLGVFVGVIAGLAALGLHEGLRLGSEFLIRRVTDPSSGAFFEPSWWVLLFPAAGGLFSGLVVQVVSKLPPAGGTDEMVHAFHHRDGVLPLRGPLIRAVASIGVISSGGSAGPEGPIAGLGAAIGSVFGRTFGLTPRDRRILLVAGGAAGIGAIFRSPLGGALFGASVLYRRPEMEGSALVACFVASAVGSATFLAFVGFNTHMFLHAENLHFASALEIPIYVALGLCCGGVSIVYSESVKRMEHFFKQRDGIPIWVRPAIGGVLVGLLACALPQVAGGQYDLVQHALDGSLFHGGVGALRGWPFWAALFGLVVLVKCLATAFTIGSGGAGGLLGPCVFIGGATGAFFGAALSAIAPGLISEPLRQALVAVGMAGVLAGSMRVPIAALVMVTEMTGGFGLIVPLMLVVVTAYAVGHRFGMMDVQMESIADSPAHAGDAVVNVLERQHVADAMQGVWPAVVNRAAPLDRIAASLPTGIPPLVAVTEGERLVGVISFSELRPVLQEEEVLAGVVIAEDLMSTRYEALNPRQTLYEALVSLSRSGADAAPVVAGHDQTFLGMLTRDAVLKVVSGHVEAMRERLVAEHAGLAAIEEQQQIAQLLSGVPAEEAGLVTRIPVDGDLVGRSLRESDFQRRRGGVVLAIQTRDHHFLCPPDPARRLERGDRLVVLAATLLPAHGESSQEASGGGNGEDGEAVPQAS